MVAGSRIEGGTQIVSARVRKTIQSIKEIVGNHSDAEIYVTLKETDMDPNETAQKLLNQDPFHEVRRKRDKKKENIGFKGLVDPRKPSEHAGQGMKINTSERGIQNGGYGRDGASVAGGIREFRIVRDNRINQNTTREIKAPLPQRSTATSEQVNSNVTEKGSTGISNNQKSSGGHHLSQTSVTPTVSHHRQSWDANSSDTTGKELQEETAPVRQGSKPNDSQPHSATSASHNSVLGVYSSSSDPVHVPSPDSRSAAIIGAIKREVGVVGVRRQSSEHTVKASSAQNSSLSNSHTGKDVSFSRESPRRFTATSKNDQPCQTTVPDSVVPSTLGSRSFLNNQYNSRQHQQIVSHPKASQPNKEWKPKLSQKSSVNGPGVIGTLAKSVPYPPGNSKDLETDAAQVQDKPSRENNTETQNVIIAEHIRVAKSDRCRLTFGSFGAEFDSSRDFISKSHTVGSAEHSSVEPCTSLSAPAPESSSDETSASKHVDLLDDQDRNSGSNSPTSGAISENELPDKKESSSPQNLDSYAGVGLVHDDSPTYTPSESQHQQDTPELPSFSAYDPQTGYDIPYFRPTTDETIRGQGLQFPQEALNSHTANSIPASTIAMLQHHHHHQQQQQQHQQQQQQQQQVAQMYQQIPFTNLMPFRQFPSPFYCPPMPMPGYSSNATYPQPSNGNSYLLIPGGSSHIGANGLKYGIQQFKPVPAGSPTGFGNFSSPTGYAVNAPGVVGSAAGLEDPSRLKYKDGNLYVPNPQAETSEFWVQNARDLPGVQSASYYNMSGQTTHAAYLPSHTGHASFNAAAAAAAAPQSSHMQFPGLYHPPPQMAAIANPHHLGPTMGANVGVGVAAAAPGTQVGAYQQPQLGHHLNWTGNF